MNPRDKTPSHGPQTNGHPAGSQARIPNMHLPTVHEALPYSPFASIVPFNPELITPPLSLPTTAPTAFANYEDTKTAQRELERLSAGAKSAEHASQRCRQTLGDVQRLLDRQGFTEFKFKTTKRLKKESDKEKTPPQPQLSSFAKMVFDNTKVEFRYMTPVSPAPDAIAGGVNGRTDSKPLVKPQKIIKTNPAAAQVHVNSKHLTPGQQHSGKPIPKSAAQVHIPGRSLQPAQLQIIGRSPQQTHTPAPVQVPAISANNNAFNQNAFTSTPPISTSRAFVMPTAMTPAQRAEFQRVNVPVETPTRNNNAYLTNGARGASADQRQKADAAVEVLQNQLHAIFEAQDHMQPDTSEEVAASTNSMFVMRDTTEGSAMVLQATAQSALDSAVQKVVSCGRLDTMDLEQLARVQRLCEASLAVVGSGPLTIGEDWNDDDTIEWLDRISGAENGLIAGRTILRIMTGGSKYKELQSEEYLRGVLEAARNVVDSCIMPTMEERASLGDKVRGDKDGSWNPKFAIAVEHRTSLRKLINATIKCLRLLGELLAKTDVDETAISSIEFLCRSLIFAQNSGTEKDAALGTQVIENMRVAAMDLLAIIFTKYDNQRAHILNELLLSVEKLPAGKQSARQFKLIDAKPIQLISALLMRLVQTSATTSESALRVRKTKDEDEEEDESESEDSDESEDAEYDEDDEIVVGSAKKTKAKKGGHDLDATYMPLKKASQHHAGYIITNLLQRALKTTKSSDEPFRKLLDIFTEDFLNVLGSSDWPSAEVLLRILTHQMIGLADNAKSPAPSRALALELLGTIGTGILDIRAATFSSGRSLETTDDISRQLSNMVRRMENGNGNLDSDTLNSFEGPYRVVMEYLHERDLKDPQLRTARGYHLVQWAAQVCEGRDAEGHPVSPSKDLQHKIRSMIEDTQWLEENSDFPKPTTAQGKLAARIVASNSMLCKAFNRIFNTVLASMSSEQPTIRSRSLKSVTTLLEKDPSVLEHNPAVLRGILRCLNDPSSLVRDSALGLVQKCVSLRPALELDAYERIIPRTADAAIGVRKRAMAFLKQVYLRNDGNEFRARISNAVISRIQDTEESVADAAKATVEEIWFSAFRNLEIGHSDRSVDTNLRLRSHAALIIQTVALGENVVAVLEALIKMLLSTSKQAAENFRICQAFVDVLSDGVIDKDDIPGSPEQTSIMQALAVFARAGPGLFTSAQLERLVPYAKNLITTDDLDVYVFVVTILRYTLPVVPDIKPEFLRTLQLSLLSSAQKLGRAEVAVAAPCLWIIASILQDTTLLVRFAMSALGNVSALRGQKIDDDPKIKNKAIKLLTIVGQFGKACYFDSSIEQFRQKFPTFKGNSVAGLLVEVCCGFTVPKYSTEVREAAIEAVCAVSQSFPVHFMRPDVANVVQTVFQERDPALEQVLLANLEDFFGAREKSADDQDAPELGAGMDSGTQRLGGTYQATGHDSASAYISQRFLKEFLRIALSSCSEVALSAARIVASINRQGIAHPGDSGPAVVALQTCPSSAIAKLAFISYKDQFAKNESVLEKTLVKSVQSAFDYQKRVAQSTLGFTGHPPVSKFHHVWDVLKTGKGKVRTKFFTNLCAGLDFDPSELKSTGDEANPHLLYVRFCSEVLAFLEYDRIDELLHLLSCLEKVFTGTGTSVAQSIESEVLRLQVPVLSQSQSQDPTSDPTTLPSEPQIKTERLEQLTTSAQILSVLWETRSFLRRVWLLQKFGNGKGKAAAKETNRAPNRATNAPALTDTYQGRIVDIMAPALTVEMKTLVCKEFVELMSVDSEVKVADEAAEEDGLDGESWEGDARSEAGGSEPGKSPSKRGTKRKSMDGNGGGPPKKRGRPRKNSGAGRGRSLSDDEDGGWD
ncbi:sister chromatid cohesion protein mis4 [Zymoseptoria brevis]|uniref:Sister chromatid cohesion protein n=1 Tax=Zymoseptoria brevis TaxID=1047168 RepID=A0A0F4G7A1_9PEZI|nr:sister chromatid cohesion protein mis4 [Zymoseptoria brevis]